jgi:hypothetical protein
MADKQFDPKRDGPEGRHSGPPLRDLDPHSDAGQNFGLVGEHPEKDAESHQTAYEHKEAHRLLADLPDDVLKQIPMMPIGARLEEGATYLDLNDPDRGEFTASFGMSVQEGRIIIPKSEVHYEHWNRLRGVTTPERVG